MKDSILCSADDFRPPLTKRRAIVICMPDRYANAVKPAQLKGFLEARNFDVEIFATNTLSRMGKGRAHWLPGFGLKKIALYVLDMIYRLAGLQRNKRIRRFLISRIICPTIRLRGAILHDILKDRTFDLLICESSMDSAVVMQRHAAIQILDLPSPFAEELFYGDKLDNKHFNKLRKLEQACYGGADRLSFHWHTYIETIFSSKPGNRRWYLAISCGSKVDSRSRGTSSAILPVPVSTVFWP